MKIQEDLVYSKHSNRVVGFVHLSNVGDRFHALEKLAAGGKGVTEVATYILVIMVRGLTTSLCFPYTHFATSGVTGEILSSLMWEAVRQIEMVGLHVIGMTADGASSNRNFFRNFF